MLFWTGVPLDYLIKRSSSVQRTISIIITTGSTKDIVNKLLMFIDDIELRCFVVYNIIIKNK